MVFKSFYIKVIARILFLAIGLFLLNYCLVRGLYLRSVYIAVFTLALTVELMVFINKFNRKLNAFLTSTLQQDFTLHFKEHQQERSFKEFYRLLNRITALFKKIREEKEIKQRFLETLIEHVTIGLASFDQEGNVQFVNSAFLRITGHLRLTHIRQLQFDNRQLADAMTGVAPNGITMVKWHKHNQLLNLAVYATVFKVDSKEFKLISLQNITHELNAHEMEAWQKLIRVLTHEIMNSISPIISLSGTLHNLLHKKNRENGLTGANDWTALVAGVGAIKTRSEGLHYFTQKYRELTHIPAPHFQSVYLSLFLENVLLLMQPELNRRNITLSTAIPAGLSVVIDHKLLEQVMINLIRNSLEALEHTEKALMTIRAEIKNGQTHISVEDNGCGIEEAHLDQIFVPFFTTKKGGTGIGLALVRQIVLLHKGQIDVKSKPQHGTVVTMML